MPQKNNHFNIIQESKDNLSTTLIHNHSKNNQIQNPPKNKYKKALAIENLKQFTWEEVAVLSWILLDKEEAF
ncbi:MAG: DUF1836 domain-containing protein [Nitrosopumilus sp.]|nr:DUF1836 domain-containing protein [Nitrosopumilus sp.]MDH3487753.1 DUF1836 domain-containing protein [Nitrosopumilus sp.]